MRRGLSEGQFRRAIGIFSVVSSPSRLEILRQLNAKGAMSYSELKASTGFRAKKESGKFAYHLRKLLKQGLIQHNRADRKYNITPLGRLVLNAAREIDERALLHVDQAMVRTSHETMEPFNPNKLVQSLVKEAGMTKESAQKVASEIEHQVVSREGLYLTSPMIRAIAYYLLVSEGREEEGARFSKLGMSLWDLEQMLSSGPGLQRAVREAGARVLRERELFSYYPKDVVDAHLEGELNLIDVGTSTVAPDFVSVPLDGSMGLERLLSLALSTRIELSLVVRGGDPGEIRRLLLTAEQALRAYEWPVLINAVLLSEGLLDVARGLSGTSSSRISFTLAFPNGSAALREMASRGLAVSSSPSDQLRSFMGAPVDPELPTLTLIGASVNMPRLSYETQGDEAYFSARLLQVVEKASSALDYRARAASTIGDRLPGARMFSFVNLIGYAESQPARRLGPGIVRLVESTGVRAAFIYDPRSALRLRRLDAERIPSSELPRAPGWVLDSYTSGHYAPQEEQRLPALAYARVVQAHELDGVDGHVAVIPTMLECGACGALNPPGSSSCTRCGSAALSPLYSGSLAP